MLEDLEGDQSATDEGRAMLQIAHDVAPASKLCFATAIGGLLHFADNIRALADKKGKCRADVVVDDVGYFEEPFFSDSALSDAIDEVAAKGTHYFTSAGNDGVAQSWNSKVRLLNAKKAVKGTNIDLSEVDPALYDGGLQDMNPGKGDRHRAGHRPRRRRHPERAVGRPRRRRRRDHRRAPVQRDRRDHRGQPGAVVHVHRQGGGRRQDGAVRAPTRSRRAPPT